MPAVDAGSHRDGMSGWWQRTSTTKLLLLAAIPAVVVYVIGDVLASYAPA